MQTLRKKNSPCKFKNEPTRFLGEGVSFKAKLIGILEVSEARGDRMCQTALADLKMAIRAAGEHKQRIAVEVSIDGLRLRDEKSGVCLFHHPVHKISFICQDMSDTRAFGYIFGSPDTGHRFFGIKTDKAASQVVIAVRELFQVVLELKKKEIELAKQQIEQNAINAIKFHTSGIFVEPAPDTKGAAGTESSLHRMRTTNSEQGIHQMDKITPENPAPSSEELLESDPFGDSFANMKLKETLHPILPPPPSSSKRSHLERQQTLPGPQTSASSSPATIASKTPPPQNSMHWFDKEAENIFNDNETASLTETTPEMNTKRDSDEAQAKSPQVDVFTELDPLGTGLIKPYVDKKDFFQHLKNPPKKVLKDLVSTNTSDTFPTDFHSSSDALEKVPGDSGSRDSDQFEDSDFANFDRFEEKDTLQQTLTRSESPRRRDSKSSLLRQLLSGSVPPEEPPTPKTTVTQGPSTSPATITTHARVDKEPGEPMHTLVKLPSPKKYLQSARKKEFDFEMAGSRGQSMDKSFPVDFTVTTESPASPLRSCSSDANSRLSTSSAELELVPEPPPRGAGSILINPPPLPPKKQNVRGGMKPPPRPPHTDAHFHYDFPERVRASPSPTRSRERPKSPLKDTKSQFDDNFSPTVSHATARSDIIASITTSAFEDSFSSMIPTTSLSSYFTSTSTPSSSSKAKPSLDITLSQLTSSNLNELANSLGMTVQELTSLTLQQLTECLASLPRKESVGNDSEAREIRSSKHEFIRRLSKIKAQAQALSTTMEQSHFVSSEPLFKPNFDLESKQESTYDKYAVFRELVELEQLDQPEQIADIGMEEQNDEEVSAEEIVEPEKAKRESEFPDASISDCLASSVRAFVRLPPADEPQAKEEFVANIAESSDIPADLKSELDQSTVVDENDPEFISYLQMIVDGLTKQTADVKVEDLPKKGQPVELVEEKILEERIEIPSKDSDASDSPEKGSTESNIAEISPAAPEKPEETTPQSSSTDRYAALREIIGEPEPIIKTDDEPPSPARVSPVAQQPKQSRSLAEAELLNLFSDPLPSPSSPKKQLKKEDDLKAVAMDIFEEIKMLNTGIQQILPDKEAKSLVAGFEDVFCPFSESKSEKEEMKDDGNWAKFDTGVFGSDRSSGEGPRSIGGTSPWSPDGKEFHRETSFKGSMHRHSGDSDNEWKDEEESEESNGRMMGEARSWCRHPRFNPPAFEDRSFYEESPGTPSDKRERDRSFRDRMGRKTRGAPWHRPPPWHEEGQWEEDPWHNSHCKMTYKDVEDPCLRPYWKCRPKSQLWKRGPDHPATYDEERKRRLMLWSEEDRFGSQESMCYEDEENWPRRKYDRRRWEEDPRYARRMAPPHEGDYPMRESYYYYRESRERPHGYPPAWDQEYGQERPADESPRYNPNARKRHWPKRPNSANDGRNAEMVYSEPRSKFGSRSECSDNDSDPYLRPSQRSRSRESYWGSDQEYDSWVERPYWSEGPEPKSESLHRKRIPRHKGARQPPVKTRSPFEDDFSQSGEQAESPAVETPGPEPRVRPEANEGKREPPSASPSTSGRLPAKEHFVGFEYDLTPTASASSDTSDRQRAATDLKATPEELPCDPKEPPQQAIDGFVGEDGGRDSFFNGDLRYDDDAFAFKSELEDSVPDPRTNLPLKNARQSKYASGNNNNSKTRGDQYIRKSESVNIFVRESDPFDDDDFFN